MTGYVAITFDGDELAVTAKELQGLTGQSGLVFIRSLNEAIHTSAIKRVVTPEKAAALRRAKSNHGTLHDGTAVVRRFGLWCNASNPEIAMDVRYYPELAKDTPLLSDDEWRREVLPLPTTQERRQRYDEMCAGTSLALEAADVELKKLAPGV